MGRVLSRSFFARDADLVARDLLGRLLVHETLEGITAVRIVETEAYFGPPGRNPQLAQRSDLPAPLRQRLLKEGDPASHSYPGVTKRNSVMYGPPGRAYVYLIYGMHDCMNVTTGPDGEPQAVLLRAGEPVEGLDLMRGRRPRARKDTDLASGPARLAQAMGITRALYGASVMEGPLRFEAGRRVEEVEVTPRVNVVGGEDLPLRFVAAGSPHASRPARAAIRATNQKRKQG